MQRAFVSPTELTQALDAVEHAVGLVLKDVFEPWDTFGRYESDVEARLLFFALVRHVEGVLECGRSDVVLFPAGATLTRTAFEQAVRVCWMLHPQDVMVREGRFLAHLSEEERMWRRCARASGEEPVAKRGAPLREFRELFEKKLPAHVPRLKGLPKFDEMLRELGEPGRYVSYILLSQFSHGSHYAGWMYRRHLGTAKELAERSRVRDWAELLRICWWSVFQAAQALENTSARRQFRSVDAASIDAVAVGLRALAEAEVSMPHSSDGEHEAV